MDAGNGVTNKDDIESTKPMHNFTWVRPRLTQPTEVRGQLSNDASMDQAPAVLISHWTLGKQASKAVGTVTQQCR